MFAVLAHSLILGFSSENELRSAHTLFSHGKLVGDTSAETKFLNLRTTLSKRSLDTVFSMDMDQKILALKGKFEPDEDRKF